VVAITHSTNTLIFVVWWEHVLILMPNDK